MERKQWLSLRLIEVQDVVGRATPRGLEIQRCGGYRLFVAWSIVRVDFDFASLSVFDRLFRGARTCSQFKHDKQALRLWQQVKSGQY